MFLVSALFCIPYWLKFKYTKEKGLQETEIGKNPLFNRIVHFWMYMPMAYIIPFTILILTNFYLVGTIMIARRRRKRLGMAFSQPNNQQSSLCKHEEETTKPDKLNTNGNETLLLHPKKSSIKRQTSPNNESLRRRQQNQRAGGMNITIMLIAVVCLFFCCQFPVLILHVFQSMYCSDNRHICNSSPLFLYAFQASKFLLICNLSFNFACYCLFSKKFRLVLKETMKCIKQKSSAGFSYCTMNLENRDFQNYNLI